MPEAQFACGKQKGLRKSAMSGKLKTVQDLSFPGFIAGMQTRRSGGFCYFWISRNLSAKINCAEAWHNILKFAT